MKDVESEWLTVRLDARRCRTQVLEDEFYPTTGKIAVKVINHYGDEVMQVYEV